MVWRWCCYLLTKHWTVGFDLACFWTCKNKFMVVWKPTFLILPFCLEKICLQFPQHESISHHFLCLPNCFVQILYKLNIQLPSKMIRKLFYNILQLQQDFLKIIIVQNRSQPEKVLQNTFCRCAHVEKVSSSPVSCNIQKPSTANQNGFGGKSK